MPGSKHTILSRGRPRHHTSTMHPRLPDQNWRGINKFIEVKRRIHCQNDLNKGFPHGRQLVLYWTGGDENEAQVICPATSLDVCKVDPATGGLRSEQRSSEWYSVLASQLEERLIQHLSLNTTPPHPSSSMCTIMYMYVIKKKNRPFQKRNAPTSNNATQLCTSATHPTIFPRQYHSQMSKKYPWKSFME